MGYYSVVCDKTTKLEWKNNQLKSISNIQYEKCFRIKHTIKNPIIFDIEKIFNDCITNHIRKIWNIFSYSWF